MITAQMETTTESKSQSRSRSLSVISISSDDDTPPSKRKRSANTTPQPETPSKKLVTGIDDMALIDGGLQSRSRSLENSQLEPHRDTAFPSEETYRLKSAAILRMLYADEAPLEWKNDSVASKGYLEVSTATPFAKCYRYPAGKDYRSASDSNDNENPQAVGEHHRHSDSFYQTTMGNQPNVGNSEDSYIAPAEASPGLTSKPPWYTIDRPYKCHKCGSRWKAEARLKHHLTKSLTACNPNWDPSQADPRGRPRIYNLSDLKCEQCGFQFRTEATYKHHITKSQTTCNPHWVAWVSSQAKASEPLPSESSTHSMLEHAGYRSPYLKQRPSNAKYVSQYDIQARLPILAPMPVPPSPGPIVDLTLTPPVSGPASSQTPNPTPVDPVQELRQTQEFQSTPSVAHDVQENSA